MGIMRLVLEKMNDGLKRNEFQVIDPEQTIIIPHVRWC